MALETTPCTYCHAFTGQLMAYRAMMLSLPEEISVDDVSQYMKALSGIISVIGLLADEDHIRRSREFMDMQTCPRGRCNAYCSLNSEHVEELRALKEELEASFETVANARERTEYAFVRINVPVEIYRR